MLNRALMGAYPPGSTFKTAQALTFLQEGIIQPSTSFPCSHGFIYGGLRVGCHGHGSPLPLIPAIATSCNAYFCWGLYRMFGDKKYGSPQNALTVWKDHMVSQGFGYKLGTDLPGEKRGFIPNAGVYDKAYRGSWNGLTVISTGVTGSATCRIAGAILPGVEVCGKTGTAQNRGHDHSAFIGFAPMDKPKIAIAVYVENGGWGATYGVPYGALMMEQYLNGKLSPASEERAEEMSNRVIMYGDEER